LSEAGATLGVPVTQNVSLAALAVLALVAPALAGGAAPPPAVAGTLDSPESAGLATDHAGTGAAPSAGAGPPATATPRIVAVVPNPAADGDRGERVLVRFPAAANRSQYTLSDGDARVRLGNGTAAPGLVAVGANATAVAARAPESATVVAGDIALANGGERLVLRRGNRTVDVLVYDDAPTAERYRNGTWTPVGATDLPVRVHGPAPVETFVLPDAPGAALGPIRNATERVLLAGYTLTSERVVDALLAAHERGVRVRVLVDADPVGGRSRQGARALDALAAGGVPVRVLGGDHGRYAVHHPKYAVADDSAVVLTENWKPAGVGGRSSRGWGAVVHDAGVAADLAELFRADFAARDASPWSRYRRGRHYDPAPVANGTFGTRRAPGRHVADEVRVLVAPDNAEGRLVGAMANATDSLDVLQVGVGGRDGPFVTEALAAARRGVEVRLLLSGAWYVREENRRVVDWLNRVAEREDLPLSARLAAPGDRFEKVHAKGVIVDGDRVAVGSLNWNAHAARENREVVVLMDGEGVAGYYRSSFAADWERAGDGASGERPGLRVWVGLAAIAAVAAALWLVARRVEFGTSTGVGP